MLCFQTLMSALTRHGMTVRWMRTATTRLGPTRALVDQSSQITPQNQTGQEGYVLVCACC